MQSLNLAVTAELYLFRTLVKTKSIVTAPAFPPYIVSKVEASNVSTSSAYANVTARLYNSTPVRSSMSETMKKIRETLGLELESLAPPKRKRAADFNQQQSPPGVSKEVDAVRVDNSQLVPDDILLSPMHSNATVSPDELEDGMKNDESDDYEHYASRFANSSSGASSENEDPVKRNNDDLADYVQKYSSNRLMRAAPHNTPTKKGELRDKPVTTIKATTFLPSLTMGGYISNSDSDTWESGSATGNSQPRKNRMGQQARRQLWEKKFGHKANHIKNQGRDQGWDARKGAQGGEDRGWRAGSRGRMAGRAPPARGGRASGANTDPVGVGRHRNPVSKTVDGPLHPSWEAAKKLKEAKQSTAFVGKKTTFT